MIVQKFPQNVVFQDTGPAGAWRPGDTGQCLGLAEDIVGLNYTGTGLLVVEPYYIVKPSSVKFP